MKQSRFFLSILALSVVVLCLAAVALAQTATEFLNVRITETSEDTDFPPLRIGDVGSTYTPSLFSIVDSGSVVASLRSTTGLSEVGLQAYASGAELYAGGPANELAPGTPTNFLDITVNGVPYFELNSSEFTTVFVPLDSVSFVGDSDTLSAVDNNLIPVVLELLTTDAGGSTLHGMTAGVPLHGNPDDGEIVYLLNKGPGSLTLVNESGSATAAGNRFTLPQATDFVIPVDGGASLLYDNVDNRWRIAGANTSGVISGNADISGALATGGSITVSNNDPLLRLADTSIASEYRFQVSNNIARIMRADGGVFDLAIFQGDGVGGGTEVELNATTLDFNGNTDISGTLNWGGGSSIADSDNVALLDAHNVFTSEGSSVLTDVALVASSALPALALDETDGAADERFSVLRMLNGNLQLISRTDADSPSDTLWSSDRTGGDWGDFLIGPGISWGGGPTIDTSGEHGTFTLSFDGDCDPNQTMDVTYYKFGDTVTLRSTGVTCTSDSFTFQASDFSTEASNLVPDFIFFSPLLTGENNGSDVYAKLDVDNSGFFGFQNCTASANTCSINAWNSSGTKSIDAFVATYYVGSAP